MKILKEKHCEKFSLYIIEHGFLWFKTKITVIEADNQDDDNTTLYIVQEDGSLIKCKDYYDGSMTCVNIRLCINESFLARLDKAELKRVKDLTKNELRKFLSNRK